MLEKKPGKHDVEAGDIASVHCVIKSFDTDAQHPAQIEHIPGLMTQRLRLKIRLPPADNIPA